jgi:general secretion pathway protein D
MEPEAALWAPPKTEGDAEPDVLAALKQVPLFENLSARELKKIARLLHERTYRPGEVIFREGDPGAGMFIVRKGKVNIVIRRPDGSEQLLTPIEERQFFGEMALLEAAPRSASAVAAEKSELLGFFEPDLESLIERTRNMTPQGQELPNDVRLPASLTFRDAPSRDVFTALARFANINITFDPQFRDSPVTIDLRETTLETALQALTAATRSFYRITGPRFITVVPDTPAKRQEYEEEIVRTFPLSNADLKETVDLLRIVIDARRLAPVTATNTIAIKDTPARVAAAGKLIAAIDKARPEVVIDVELLEIDRTRLKEYGLQIASPTADSSTGPTGINGQVDVNRQNLTLRDVRNLTQSDVFLTNVPALYYRLLKQDTNTRILANPQLRTSEGMPAQARFGERVPVPVTTFSPIATGGISQQPITSFNYENIGVNIDITPRTHHDDEVSLALKLEVSSISGAGFGGLPTFGNRYVSTVIRLHDGETNLLAGLIRDDERRVLSGIVGLSDLPLVGRLFAHNRKENLETDIVLTLTPRIVRVLDLSEDDLRPFRVGRDGDITGAAPGVVPLPLPVELPPPATMQPGQPQQPPQPQPQAPPPAPPGGTGTAPIRPPTGTPPTPER